MNEHTRSISQDAIRPKRFAIQPILMLLLACFLIYPGVSNAQENGKVQEITGKVGLVGGLIYNLDGLSAGDELFVFAERTTGNLDPIVALAPHGLAAGELSRDFDTEVDQAIAQGEDPLIAIPRIVDDLFIAWDDDSGEGYSSALKFTIPEDGDYQLVMTSSPAVDTFGDFRLLIGLNEPDVMTGKARPTGDIIAVLDHDSSQVGVAVQEVQGSLTPDLNSTFYTLRNFLEGDTLYVYAEAISGDLRPIVLLNDFGNKPLRSGNFSGSESSASFEYTFDDDTSNLQISIEACCEDGPNTQGEYRLLVGANAPNVLTGQAKTTGTTILQEPILVRIGTKLQQITNVDQKAENFGAVATLKMEWHDPRLAFSPDTCDCNFKVFNGTDFADFIVENDHTAYFERFTATLQAPDFDFRNFPFDEQVFYIRVDSLYPEEFILFSELEGYSEIGAQLGEEEWSVTEYDTEVTSEDGKSRFSFQFNAERHLNFYIFRIFLPILIIIIVSWITFFLKDYGKRVDVAGANLLLFIAFNFTISDELPKLGYLTFLDTILITTFVITGFVLILNVILKRLELSGKEELAQKLDRFMVWLYPISFVAAMIAVTVLLP
jgi:hypothetical protein